MTDEIVQFDSKNITVTPYGIEFPGTPSLAEWKRAMLGLQKAATMVQFYLGDLYLYAEYQWGGDTYKDLVEHSGYDKQTLMHFTWVSRRFPLSLREQICPRGHICSFSHYREVAHIPDDQQAVRLLQLAGKSGWSVERLREEVQKIKGNRLTDGTEWLNLRVNKQEAGILFDFLATDQDPTIASICERLGKYPECGRRMEILDALR